MKKLAISIILIVTLFGVTACNGSTAVKSNKNEASVKVSNRTNVASNNETAVVSNSSSNEVDSPTGNSTVINSNDITNISAWTHPVKYVFQNNNVIVDKVEFKNNRTYPIFYVELGKNLNDENKTYYKNLINQVATANGYWNYEIIDTNKKIDIVVTCNRSTRTVKEITNNGDESYFSSMLSTNTNSDDEIVQYLINNVNEVSSFVNSLKSNTNGVKAIVYVEREPDSNSSNEYLKNYYGVYVGESYPDHNVNIYRFAVNKDTKEILYYDVVNDKYETLSEWRQNK